MHLELGFALKDRWFNYLKILIALLLLVDHANGDGAIGDIEKNLVKAPDRASSASGVIKMCPAGGDVFSMAWQLSCGMKKRRKRGIYTNPVKRDNNEYRALSLSEMMKFCCKYGCTIRDLVAYCDPFGDWDS